MVDSTTVNLWESCSIEEFPGLLKRLSAELPRALQVQQFLLKGTFTNGALVTARPQIKLC